MAYLISQLWVWLLLALALGLVIGWMTCANEETKWWGGWVPLGTIAFLIGIGVAIMRMLPDRAGFWLDSALLMFGTYIVGCCLGCLIRQGLKTCCKPKAAVMAAAPVRTVSEVKPAVAAPVVSAPAASPVAIAEPAPVVTSPAPVDEPPPAAAVEGEESFVGTKPKTYASPRGGKGDDLKRIRGIGKQNEGRLHALGIWHFDQIAAWLKSEVEWVGSYLAFPGRIEREDWVAQAKVLATGGETEFSQRVDRGEVATSLDAGDKGQNNVASMTDIKK